MENEKTYRIEVIAGGVITTARTAVKRLGLAKNLARYTLKEEFPNYDLISVVENETDVTHLVVKSNLERELVCEFKVVIKMLKDGWESNTYKTFTSENLALNAFADLVTPYSGTFLNDMRSGDEISIFKNEHNFTYANFTTDFKVGIEVEKIRRYVSKEI